MSNVILLVYSHRTTNRALLAVGLRWGRVHPQNLQEDERIQGLRYTLLLLFSVCRKQFVDKVNNLLRQGYQLCFVDETAIDTMGCAIFCFGYFATYSMVMYLLLLSYSEAFSTAGETPPSQPFMAMTIKGTGYASLVHVQCLAGLYTASGW